MIRTIFSVNIIVDIDFGGRVAISIIIAYEISILFTFHSQSIHFNWLTVTHQMPLSLEIIVVYHQLDKIQMKMERSDKKK